jgi:hypothetical protein
MGSTRGDWLNRTDWCSDWCGDGFASDPPQWGHDGFHVGDPLARTSAIIAHFSPGAAVGGLPNYVGVGDMRDASMW